LRKSWRCLLFYLPACWLATGAVAAWASSAQVLLVLSESSAIYRQVADSFQQSLAGKHALQVRLLEEMRPADWAAANEPSVLIVAVGSRAVRAVPESDHRGSVLALMVSRASLETAPRDPTRHAAVIFDPPPERYFAFTRRLLPTAKRIGVIVSSDDGGNYQGYASAAARAGLSLVTEQVQVQEDVPKALQNLLPTVDVLLLAPDPVVVNERTARLILMASYRHKVPVIGYSMGLARAGAVGALIAGPEEIGRLGGLLAQQWNPGSESLPAIRYAERFQIDFNRQVARSLGVAVPDERNEAAWRSGF
jgi:hypothetical protein